MSPSLKSKVVPISEVPQEDVEDEGMSAVENPREPVVLVVDDDRLVADTLGLIFRRAGFCAFTAYDGSSALGIASTVSPDILVSDVHMPRMNGVDLAMAMMKLTPECQVLLFSGHATSSDLAVARAAGHNFSLLMKPVHPTELLKWVSKCLGTSWAAAKSRTREVTTMPRFQQIAQ
jgi:DNA-binding NtrC family response regulator